MWQWLCTLVDRTRAQEAAAQAICDSLEEHRGAKDWSEKPVQVFQAQMIRPGEIHVYTSDGRDWRVTVRPY